MRMRVLLISLAISTILFNACATVEVEDEVVPAEEEAVGEEEEVTLPAPDAIFFNGQIVTMEPDMPQAEAIAIKGEDILAVGSDDEIRALSGPDTQEIDLEGRTLLPGFIDTHAHYFGAFSRGEITLDDVQDLILGGGITTIGEMTVDRDRITTLQDLEQTDRLRVRTNAYLEYISHCGDIGGDWYLEYPPILDTSRMLRIPGVKMFSDGGSCRRPAFSVDLPLRPGEEENDEDDPRGDLFFTSEELTEMILDAQSHGYQVAIHALGDRAIETVLDAYEAALDGQPNVYRHRLEHNFYIRPDFINRYSEIDIVVSGFWLSPNNSWGLENPDVYLGAMIAANPDAKMMYWMNPWRSLLDANPGLHACWQSDWIINTFTGTPPIPAMFSMVTRKKLKEDEGTIWEPPDWFAAEAITVEEALRIMTIEGAYALFMEEKIGSLKPGKFADLVILSENPLTIDPDDIINIEVLVTMVGGKVEYCAPGSEGLCFQTP